MSDQENSTPPVVWRPMGELSRRRFMEVSGKLGFTAAAVAAAGGALFSPQALAQTSKEERARKSAAKWTMTIATAYRVGTTRSYRSCNSISKKTSRT